MEDIGTEISEKIRAAIKAKLVELGAFVDNELPDYVMIMVANKRTRQQMNDDLHLFLGSNTKIFTSWLCTVMQRLQEVTVADFDVKRGRQKSKGEKRKRSNSEESVKKEIKSPTEQNKTSRKHLKKVKDGKKLKKSKYKAKEKEKDKEPKIKQEIIEPGENDDKEEDKPEVDKGPESSQVKQPDSPSDNNKDKVTAKEEPNLSDSSLPKVPEKIKESYSDNEEPTSTNSSSPSHYSNENVKDTDQDEPEDDDDDEEEEEDDGGEEEEEEEDEDEEDEEDDEEEEEDEEDADATTEVDEDEEMEDESNTGQRKETDDHSGDEKSDEKPIRSKVESQDKATETFKVPTRELLREHNRMFREREGNFGKRRRKSDPRPAPEVVAPPPPPPPREESRKHTQKRTKSAPKFLIGGKRISLPPEFDIFDFCSRTKADAAYSALRAKRISQRRDHDVEEDEEDNFSGLSPIWGYYSLKPKPESAVPSTSEPKSNIISISKSLEMEKNLGIKIEEPRKKSGNKKPVSSKICTIPEPEEPEIPSVIKVKPREFVPKEKQANKALILKAVADAEKSIATAHNRNDSDIEAKKSEGLFTKNLRGKRYEKLAVTLSNVQAGGSVADRAKCKRVVSLNSENTNVQDRKTGSMKDSEVSQGVKSIPEVTVKNISSKSEDQFISSKTSAMEKNDKYIHCWLEGVEKAVKDEEIVNPGDMDTYPVSFSGEEKDNYIPSTSSEEELEEEEEIEEEEEVEEEELEEGVEEDIEEGVEEEVEEDDAQSGQPLDDEEATYEDEQSEEKISGSTKGDEDEGPEIVVTLDGLTSKAIKNIIIRSRDSPNGPRLGSSSKKTELTDEETAERPGIRYRVDSPVDAGTSKQSGSDCADKGNKFEKISERFGRINKTSEDHEFKEKYYEFERERYEKKCQKYQGTDKEKHYQKLKDKYASPGESKNKKLIARLSEKFGKVDREFDDKKKKYSDDDLRYSYYKRADKGTGKDVQYSKRDRNSKNQSKP